jgi:mannose-6-phosphate isomerase-like protein (cupin superfamily)
MSDAVPARAGAPIEPSRAEAPRIASREDAPHYRWGTHGEGWRLHDGDDLSVIEEALLPGGAERTHRHASARQFFYILEGKAVMEIDGIAHALVAGRGIAIPPGIAHRFRNDAARAVRFLVISAPTTRGDRQDLD